MPYREGGHRTAAIVLAGGRGSRMGPGPPKFLREFAGSPLLLGVIARVQAQVDTVLLSCNLDPATLPPTGCVTLPDAEFADAGPLAGVLTAMEYLRRRQPRVEWLLSVAADTPWLPPDLGARLHAARARREGGIAVASSGGRRHHVIALWPLAAAATLREALLRGERSVAAVQAHLDAEYVEWTTDPLDPFFNINTAQDLARAESMQRAADAASAMLAAPAPHSQEIPT